MSMSVVFSRDGRTAETGLPETVRFFHAAGMIEPCTLDDIPDRESVSYPRSGCRWGSTEYIRTHGRVGDVYRLVDPFTHGHLELASKRKYEREREQMLSDVNARVDAVLAGRDPLQ